MDWLLTVPLLLIEILLVMKLDERDFSEKARTLGVGSALMIISGYYGELTVTGDLSSRWICWCLSMMFFLYIVYELLVGEHDGNHNVSLVPLGFSGRTIQDRHRAGRDRDQLVHVSSCIPLSNARF